MWGLLTSTSSRPWAVSLTIALCSLISTAPLAVKAQSFARNGQFFTKGLAISDAPAPGSPQHAGSNLVIAVDLSGNGKIAQDAFLPGSGQSTRYDSLSVYLISAQTNQNFTVSSGPTLLSQEPGSTVKHLNWPIPKCVTPGSYNLTYYEGSHINNQPFFSITPILISMQNPSVDSNTAPCSAIANTLSSQPQTDSAPSINPYLDPNSPLNNTNGQSGNSGNGIPTITIGSSGLPSAWSTDSNGAPTMTGPVTTATIVVVSAETLTETLSGNTSPITTTELLTSTMTMIMPTAAITDGGFLPVNKAMATHSLVVSVMSGTWTFIVMAYFILCVH